MSDDAEDFLRKIFGGGMHSVDPSSVVGEATNLVEGKAVENMLLREETYKKLFPEIEEFNKQNILQDKEKAKFNVWLYKLLPLPITLGILASIYFVVLAAIWLTKTI